jgi:hypothetical protein
MNAGKTTSDDGDDEEIILPEIMVGGVRINLDRIDDAYGTILLFDKSGRQLAEVLNVAKITIGTTWAAVCAAAAAASDAAAANSD